MSARLCDLRSVLAIPEVPQPGACSRDLAFYGVGKTVSEKPDKWNGWGWPPVDSTSQP